MRTPLDITKIVKTPLNEGQYFRQTFAKKQFVLHFSAGSDNIKGMFAWWNQTPERVATCWGVDDKGTVYEGFDPSHWAAHIGLGVANNLPENLKKYQTREHALQLEYSSIGVEVGNFGPLTYKDGKFLTYVNSEIKKEKVIELEKPYRGYKFFEAPTDLEIDALWQLCRYVNEKYGIPKVYNPGMWELSEEAISGKPGIWCHSSFHAGKYDWPPMPKLVEMMKAL